MGVRFLFGEFVVLCFLCFLFFYVILCFVVFVVCLFCMFSVLFYVIFRGGPDPRPVDSHFQLRDYFLVCFKVVLPLCLVVLCFACDLFACLLLFCYVALLCLCCFSVDLRLFVVFVVVVVVVDVY